MKKTLLFVLLSVLFGLSSCMDTYYVTKKSTFDEGVRSIRSQMADRGFNSTGEKTNTRNETTVAGVSYSQYMGYGTAMENNYITEDTHSFADSLGNTMNYSVSYQAKQTQEGIQYVENLELCGCEASNPKEYEKLCGDDSPVKQINELPKDQKVEKLNLVNTSLVIVGVTLLVSLVTLMLY